jgi:hypothetical protein
MCFGPSSAERAAMRAQREAAEEQKRAELAERARTKEEDVSAALSSRTIQSGRRGGAGRRSLFTSMSGGSGYASRF